MVILASLLPVILLSTAFSSIAIAIAHLNQPISFSLKSFALRIVLLLVGWMAFHIWSAHDYLSHSSARYLPNQMLWLFLLTLPFVGATASYWLAQLLIDLKRARWWALSLEPIKLGLLLVAKFIFDAALATA